MTTEPHQAVREPVGHKNDDLSTEEARAGLRAVLTLLDRWGLSAEDQRILLGRPSPRTFQRWRSGNVANISFDTAQRISYLLGIHKALRILFQDTARGYAWISKPNTAFGGRSALDRMRGGDVTDLAAVRHYLDSVRGGW
jgi:uncharacterized protein (DUF2384 family)